MDAANFLLRLWQTQGVPTFTQVSCFSGGFTHPGVLGKVVRLALMAGTELVFSPIRYPKAQASIERFHQDYGKHVWEDTLLEDIDQVNQRAERFIARSSARIRNSRNRRSPHCFAHGKPVHCLIICRNRKR